MNDDATLLRRYAEEGSETAFTELVRRHVDLVYAAALRRTNGDAHAAADVAQQVFTTLARKARTLSRHPVLSAWLHAATRNGALNLMLSAQRRKKREAEAFALEAANASAEPSADWEQIHPWLDAAIDELPDLDRAAIVLRFLERRAFAEIGAALRVSEDAARMRTERALEKLRTALAQRGITSTATALGALVAAQPVVSAPAGLAAALAAHSIATTSSGTLALSFVSLMSTKIIATAAFSALLAFWIGTRVSHPPATVVSTALAPVSQDQMVASLRQDKQRLNDQIFELRREIVRLNEAQSASAAKPAPANAAPTGKNVTLGMADWEIQNATLSNLRQIDAARRQYQLENGRLAGSIHDLVGRKSYIKTVRSVNGEDYTAVSMNPTDPITVTAPNGASVTYDPSGAATTQPDFPPEVRRVQELGARVQPLVKQAVDAYRAANGGRPPADERALIPYFPTPKDGADFVELLEAKKAAGL